MRTAVVTGASGGLGLALVRALLGRGDRVVATAREPERAERLDAVVEAAGDGAELLRLDVTEPTSAAAAAARVGRGVDLVLNAAGIWAPRGRAAAASGPLSEIEADALDEVLRVNAVGPVVVAQAFAPLLARAGGGVLANLSSGLGSLERGRVRPSLGYAMSKAALNMATRHLAAELADNGIDVVALDPGWVRTELGGADAPLETDEAAEALLRVIDELGGDATGSFLDRRGRAVPW